MFPSKLHLAYALAVIRSKPPDLSVKDYILHLREHVRPKSKSNANKGSERHLDSASYWVQRFHQADAARAKLETKLTEHEREIERLKSELHSAQNTSAARATPSTRKRKDAVLPTSSAPAAKRRKIEPNHSYAPSVETVDDTLLGDMEALSAVHEEGSKLTQHLYHAHKHYKDHTHGDRQLAYHLVQATDCLAPLLASACKQHHQRIERAQSRLSGTNDAVPEPVLVAYDNELVSTFEAAARIFMSLFFGLKKLVAEKRPTPEERGAVMYTFVRMFGQVLDILRESSSSQAAQEAALTLAANSRRQMTTRGSQKLFGRTAKQDALATRLLSNFLSNVLNTPLPSAAANGSETPSQHRHHQELVEGFLFVLFRRLGNRVFLCTFGHRKCASVEADIDAWVDPAAATEKEEGEPAEEEDPPPPSETDDREKQIQQRALAIELPLLVALLERGLAVARHHIAPVPSSSRPTTTAGGSRKHGAAAGTRTAATRTTTTAAFSSAPRPSRSSSSSSSRPSAETLKAGLSLLARKKLERTLAQAIFFPGGGGEEHGDGDEASRDEMSECLMMPVRQALVEPVAGPQRAKAKKKALSSREGGGEAGEGEGGDVKAWFVERVWGLVGWEAVLEMR
ncbi:hypothetical protein SLS58_001707 [Diplodia intermedia]|uniref:Uncharacterized protein n=1 Tax=Diplodia intermedia TaxID=856260 RepID=A0ABR3U1R6_9PEZI